jgi:hypothetical protein
MENKTGKGFIAKRYYSGFSDAHDTYNAISAASDGNIYYVLSSVRHDIGAQFYRYKPEEDITEFIADLSDVLGEKEARYISQGKSHVEFYEHNGRLFFATHIGYYERIDGMDKYPERLPEGYKQYPGGHFLYYDLKTGEIKSLAIAPDGGGIVTMTMDKERERLYGITWPKGRLMDYDIKRKTLKDLGPVNEPGQKSIIGKDYCPVLCRSMFVDSRDGRLYYSTAAGDIFSYLPGDDSPQKLANVDLRLDYFGSYDYTEAGSMAYNWRKIFWYEKEQVAYGVHGNSGYLFRFDPRNQKIELLERIVSEPSKRCGMFDLFSYGYLGFILGDDDTIYYLTGAPIYKDGQRVKGVDKIKVGAARGLEHLHLVTYHIPSHAYKDHGPVFYEDGSFPTYVNSIALDNKGNVYTLARFIQDGKEIEDLIKIPFSTNDK